MNCMDVQDWMAAYVAREVSAGMSRDIWQHIATCADCRSWHEEVLQMAELWEDDRPVPNLNLVTPILERLDSRAAAVPAIAEPFPAPSPSGSDLQKSRRTRWNLSNRMVFLHYGVAVSITVVLFQFGVFQEVGSLANHGVALSHQVNHLIRLFSSF